MCSKLSLLWSALCIPDALPKKKVKLDVVWQKDQGRPTINTLVIFSKDQRRLPRLITNNNNNNNNHSTAEQRKCSIWFHSFSWFHLHAVHGIHVARNCLNLWWNADWSKFFFRMHLPIKWSWFLMKLNYKAGRVHGNWSKQNYKVITACTWIVYRSTINHCNGSRCHFLCCCGFVTVFLHIHSRCRREMKKKICTTEESLCIQK